MEVISKSKADRIGKRIRELMRFDSEIPIELLEQLQLFRVSYRDDLSHVAQTVYETALKGGSDSITSFRIKRIESILSKIRREPTMALGNMGDIAGCRIMLYRPQAVKKVIEAIHSKFDVISVNDYMDKPKEDGYNGYHVYVVSPLNPKRKLEIQVRTKETHQWSSLVEIIDNIYDLKIKEGQKHPQLQRFLQLMAKKDELSFPELKEVIELDKKYSIYGRINEVFIKNYYHIRTQWLQVQDFADKQFFLFELKADKTSTIHSFQDYEEAELGYFEKFKSNDNSNFVLAHIGKPKFNRMCVAYASYVMIQHEYLNDWNKLVNRLFQEKTTGIGSTFNHLLEYTKRNLVDQATLIENEIEEIKNYESAENVNLFSLEEWKDEIDERLSKLPSRAVKSEKKKGQKGISVLKWIQNILK